MNKTYIAIDLKSFYSMVKLYDRIINPDLLVRRVNICAFNVIHEEDIPEEGPVQLELFVDYEEIERQKAAEKRKEAWRHCRRRRLKY